MAQIKCVNCMRIKDPSRTQDVSTRVQKQRKGDMWQNKEAVSFICRHGLKRLPRQVEKNKRGNTPRWKYLKCSWYFYGLYFTGGIGIAIKCDNKAIIASHLEEEICCIVAKDVWVAYNITSVADHKEYSYRQCYCVTLGNAFCVQRALVLLAQEQNILIHTWVTVFFPALRVVKSQHSVQKPVRGLLLSNAARDTKSRMCRTHYAKIRLI